MSKQLQNLLEKALITGYANINGRIKSYGYVGELESKYKITYDNETGDLKAYHWGTLILKLGSLKASKPIVKKFYGQSKSDRDALVTIFKYFDLPYGAQYLPSSGKFVVYADFGTGQEERKEI